MYRAAGSWFSFVLACIVVPAVCLSDQQPQNSTNEITRIQIDGGYGYLRCLDLAKDGTFTWTGYEPPRQSASEKRGRIEENEVKHIWALAEKVHMNVGTNEWRGGSHTCKLVLVLSNTKRQIRVTWAAKDERPQELKELMEALWNTQNRK